MRTDPPAYAVEPGRPSTDQFFECMYTQVARAEKRRADGDYGGPSGRTLNPNVAQ
eukprot:COSAG02_NODE_222_length_28382_cov_82.417601_10_plen_55_part_00